MGTGFVYTHACVQIDGSIHKKIDRKLMLAEMLFTFYLLSFQSLKANLDHREQSSLPAQPLASADV